MSKSDFMALQPLGKETPHRLSLNDRLTLTEINNIIKNPTKNPPTTSTVSTPATNVPKRACPLDSAPIYSAPSNCGFSNGFPVTSPPQSPLH